MIRRKGALRKAAVAELGPTQQIFVKETAHFLSRVAAEPFDAIRLVQFVGSPLAGSSMIETAKNMYKAGGIRTFYRFFALHQFQTILGFKVGFRSIASQILDYLHVERRTLWRFTVLTTLSQFLFAAATHPLEVLRVRMRLVADTPFQYANVFDCLMDLIEHDGIGSLMQGLTCTMFGVVWSSFGRLLAHEALEWIQEKKLYRQSAFSYTLETIFSGLSGTVISQPFYLIQKKMMVSYEVMRGRLVTPNQLQGATPHSSLAATALAVHDQFGLSSFWSGSLSNSIRHTTINLMEDAISLGMSKCFLLYNERQRRLQQEAYAAESTDSDSETDDQDGEEEEQEEIENDDDGNGEHVDEEDAASKSDDEAADELQAAGADDSRQYSSPAT